MRSFNQVDLQNMMDQTREKRTHKSKFVKQLYYYTIVASLQMRSGFIVVCYVQYNQYSQLFSV